MSRRPGRTGSSGGFQDGRAQPRELGLLSGGSLSAQDIKQLLNPLILWATPAGRRQEAGFGGEREVFGGGAGPKQTGPRHGIGPQPRQISDKGGLVNS